MTISPMAFIEEVTSQVYLSGAEPDRFQDFEIALQFAKELQLEDAIARCHLGLGAIYAMDHRFQDAFSLLEQALATFISLADLDGQCKIYHILEFIYGQQGNFDRRAECSLKGFEVAKRTKNPLLGQFANSLGLMYVDNSKRLEQGIQYFHLVVEQPVLDTMMRWLGYSNLGEAYADLGDFAKAEHYLLKALAIARDREALLADRYPLFSQHFYQLAKEEIPDNLEAWTLFVIGRTYHLMHEQEKALDRMKTALTIAKKSTHGNILAFVNLEIGRVLTETEQKQEAIQAIHTAISLYQKADPLKESISDQFFFRDAFHHLAMAYESLGDTKKALDHHKQYIAYLQAVSDKEMEKRLHQHETELQLEAYQDITTMSEIGQKLTASLDLEQLLALVYHHIGQLMHIDSFILGIYDGQSDCIDLRFRIVDGQQIEPSIIALRQDEAIASCLIKKTPIIELDGVEEMPFGNRPRSSIYLPLIVENQVIGFVHVKSYRLHAYENRQIRFITTLSPYIAIALNNSRKSTELLKKTEELHFALENLKQAQTQIIQSEKMAALGELVAGVAHEINTPFGAISACAENIQAYLSGSLFSRIAHVCTQLPQEDKETFFAMIQAIATHRNRITSLEERQARKNLIPYLEEIGVQDARKIADIIVGMGLQNDIATYRSLLLHPQNDLIFPLCDEISDLLKNAQTIEMAVERVTKIIFALKSYSHVESVQSPVPCSIEEGIDTVLALFSHQIKKGIHLEKEYDTHLPILGFPDQLNQIWTNLISNALHAMQFQGTLSIRTIRAEQGVYIEFKDDGSGIDDSIKDRIFEPFFTTKKQGVGTGLGLQIVKQIVDQHQGTIEWSSEPKNTLFRIYLPALTL